MEVRKRACKHQRKKNTGNKSLIPELRHVVDWFRIVSICEYRGAMWNYVQFAYHFWNFFLSVRVLTCRWFLEDDQFKTYRWVLCQALSQSDDIFGDQEQDSNRLKTLNNRYLKERLFADKTKEHKYRLCFVTDIGPVNFNQFPAGSSFSLCLSRKKIHRKS